MVPTILNGNGTFPDKISDEARPYKKGEWVEKFVNLYVKITVSSLL
jgi:hypothetical protein